MVYGMPLGTATADTRPDIQIEPGTYFRTDPCVVIMRQSDQAENPLIFLFFNTFGTRRRGDRRGDLVLWAYALFFKDKSARCLVVVWRPITAWQILVDHYSLSHNHQPKTIVCLCILWNTLIESCWNVLFIFNRLLLDFRLDRSTIDIRKKAKKRVFGNMVITQQYWNFSVIGYYWLYPDLRPRTNLELLLCHLLEIQLVTLLPFAWRIALNPMKY